MSAEAEFRAWWEEKFSNEDWGHLVSGLVEAAWMAGYERHRELTRTVLVPEETEPGCTCDHRLGRLHGPSGCRLMGCPCELTTNEVRVP